MCTLKNNIRGLDDRLAELEQVNHTLLTRVDLLENDKDSFIRLLTLVEDNLRSITLTLVKLEKNKNQ
ncbi:MAG: hypothetical protein ACJA04_000244 [Cellvibrionaceae bacterium]|jgi:hypothetical protein